MNGNCSTDIYESHVSFFFADSVSRHHPSPDLLHVSALWLHNGPTCFVSTRKRRSEETAARYAPLVEVVNSRSRKFGFILHFLVFIFGLGVNVPCQVIVRSSHCKRVCLIYELTFFRMCQRWCKILNMTSPHCPRWATEQKSWNRLR